MQELLNREVDRFSVRKRSFRVFDEASSTQARGARRWLMRGQNFIVEWIEASMAGQTVSVESEYETLLILPEVGGAIQRAGQPAIHAAGHTICIVPAGPYSIVLEQAGRCCVIASSRADIDAHDVLNAQAYADPDPRIEPVGTPYKRLTGHGEIQVLKLDEIQAPPDKPRLKMFQTETLSINWVAYEGPRTRSQLSPHSHAHHEQGSLAISGNYEHHLRVKWGNNANLWQDDEHLAAPSPSLLVVPVNLIHTTEGIGDDAHLLIDIFSPPRADFIAKGWVYNAGDYSLNK
ncbi:MAG TPA: hypothetical protein VIP51_17010 [Eoetvoesiella sp.]